MSNQVVAIDGPAASGKTTVARLLADQLGALFFDTGALYRAVTLLAIRGGLDAADERRLAILPTKHRIEVRPATQGGGRHYDVQVDGVDETWAIRAPEIDAAISAVSAHGQVREALLPLQRRIAAAGPVVMVGRDVGTVVVPDATVKVYLDASVEERARRRFAEIRARGESTTLTSIEADLRQRDARDANRINAPLVVAADAIQVDTDGVSVPEVVAILVAIVNAAWASHSSP